MRVLATFAFVPMIAGIFGGPITPEPDQTRQEELSRIQMIQQYVNGYSNRPSDPDSIVVPEIFKMKCRINGGIGAQNATIEAAKTFYNSFRQLTNSTQVELQTAAEALDGGLASAVATTCNWVSTTASLFANFKLSAGQCLTPEEHTSFNFVRNITKPVLQYVCQNNGSGISTFLAAGGKVCLDQSKVEIDSCLSMDAVRVMITVPNLLADLLWNFPIVIVHPQSCSGFQTLQQCVVEALKKCQSPIPANHVDGLFNVMKRSSGCENLIETQTP